MYARGGIFRSLYARRGIFRSLYVRGRFFRRFRRLFLRCLRRRRFCCLAVLRGSRRRFRFRLWFGFRFWDQIRTEYLLSCVGVRIEARGKVYPAVQLWVDAVPAFFHQRGIIQLGGCGVVEIAGGLVGTVGFIDAQPVSVLQRRLCRGQELLGAGVEIGDQKAFRRLDVLVAWYHLTGYLGDGAVMDLEN